MGTTSKFSTDGVQVTDNGRAELKARRRVALNTIGGPKSIEDQLKRLSLKTMTDEPVTKKNGSSGFKVRDKRGDGDVVGYSAGYTVTFDAPVVAGNPELGAITLPKGTFDGLDLYVKIQAFDGAAVVDADTVDQIIDDDAAARRAERFDDRVEQLRVNRDAARAVEEEERQRMADLKGVNPGDSWRGIGDDEYRQIARDVQAGKLGTPAPDYLTRADCTDKATFYPAALYGGRTNMIFGESGIGKSWAAILLAKQTIDNGGRVLYLDYEDSFVSVMSRLHKIGTDVANLNKPGTDAPKLNKRQFAYRGPTGTGSSARDTTLEHPRTPTASTGTDADIFAAFTDLIGDHDTGFDVVVIDGVESALTSAGYDSNTNDVVKWYAELPEYIANTTGACVLLIDHVAKASTNKGYSVGSNQKKARLTGAAFRAEERTADKGEVRLNLYKTKDKNGGVVQFLDDVDDDLFGQLYLRPNRSKDLIAGDEALSIITPAEARRGVAKALDNEAGRRANKAEALLRDTDLTLHCTLAVAAAHLKGDGRFSRDALNKACTDELPNYFSSVSTHYSSTFDRAEEKGFIVKAGRSGRNVTYTVDLSKLPPAGRALLEDLRRAVAVDPADIDDRFGSTATPENG